MAAYYNEIDPYAAQWLRNLIARGLIAPGDVDERSIADVRADDVRGYVQCHWFAGIAGWSIALRLAGWDDARPVWTGSCPCQPFSSAGAGKAADDERHLWPRWFPLIAECRPATVFGEQVEAAIGWGWLDAVFADLEKEGYACGATVLPACGVGAPHIRQRLWFVAESLRATIEWRAGSVPRTQAPLGGARLVDGHQPDGLGDGGEACFVANADRGGRPGPQIHLSERGSQQAIPDPAGPSGDGRMDDAFGDGRRASGDDHRCDDGFKPYAASGGNVALSPSPRRSPQPQRPAGTDGRPPQEPGRLRHAGEPGDAIRPRLQEQRGLGSLPSGESGTDAREASERAGAPVGELGDASRGGRPHRDERDGPPGQHVGTVPGTAGRDGGWDHPTRDRTVAAGNAGAFGFWADCDWLPCTDGKARPVESGSFPLAHGVQRRASKLRAYGNAIVPQVATEFIKATI